MPKGHDSRSTGADSSFSSTARDRLNCQATKRSNSAGGSRLRSVLKFGCQYVCDWIVEEPAVAQCPQLIPGKGVVGVRDGGRINEERHRHAVLDDERQHVGIDRSMRVVGGEDHGSRRRAGSPSAAAVDELAERDRAVARRVQEGEVRREGLRADGHRIGHAVGEAVVDEDGHRKVVRRRRPHRHAGQKEQPTAQPTTSGLLQQYVGWHSVPARHWRTPTVLQSPTWAISKHRSTKRARSRRHPPRRPVSVRSRAREWTWKGSQRPKVADLERRFSIRGEAAARVA